MMMSNIRILAVVLCGLLISLEAFASVRYGAVYKNGQMTYSDNPRQSLQGTGEGCESDSDLLFRFTEQAAPESLNLNVEQQNATGSIAVEITITTACLVGDLTFSYGHGEIRGSIGSSGDLQVSPSPDQSITVQSMTGAMAVQTFNYNAVNPALVGEQPFLFQLIGERILFNLRDENDAAVIGTVARPPGDQILAAISVAARSLFVDPEDPGVAGDPALEDAAAALEQACREAEEGSELEALCRDIEGASGEDLAIIARAFDPNELAAVPNAANQTSQIQTINIDSRLAALRGGATGVSFDGLTLSMNGAQASTNWLPVGFMSQNQNEGSTLLGEQWGFFVNGDISVGDRDDRGKEVGFDFDSWGLTSGVDYRFNNGLVLGGAVGYSAYEADLNQDGGTLDSESWTTQVYGTYDLTQNLYLDATVSISQMDFDQVRVIDLSGARDGVRPRALAFGSTEADQWATSLSINYRRAFANGWQVTPYGQFRYAETDIDGFTEQSTSIFALRYPDQSFTSQLLSAGVRVSKPFTLERGVLVPFADFAYEYENDIDGYTLQTNLVVAPSIFGPEVEISDPDRTFARLNLGSSFVFRNGSQFFLSYSILLLESDTTSHTFYAGLRLEF
jgi:outer membrane autotransporter protein